MKRFLDITLIVITSPVTLPVMGLTALFVSVCFRRWPVFCQLRSGQYGTPFVMYKFRTMTDKSDASGNLLPDAFRLTTPGRWLRKTSLDELPQLLNVLRGDMSLIGPRPLLPEYTLLYTDFERQRQLIKPGLTGWAQIHGRNNISWQRKFELDVWYVHHQSRQLDAYILWKTCLLMLSPVAEPLMPRFTGTYD
ncbi:hypothetical protein BLX24_05445 [Arsenicibacter rosenii]|uniref:Bacterial sugar transferase domain-containing protein n=2 Tax=Arsenicibacter rosenii TaxID=1750698 RepID=A0A1S2VQP3_9BACT|nr:hypothetical protein BLX24_05445 [Arsenicibacter rosenii]